MERKIIKVKDAGFLSFLYPNYQVRYSLSIADRDENVIYVGPNRKDLRNYLERNTKSYISAVGIPDIDLSNPQSAIKWLFKEKGQELTDTVKETVESMDDEEFWFLFKVMWLTGKWLGTKDDSKYNTFHLYQSSVSSLKDELTVYFSLLETVNPLVIESSFLTFLSRVKTLESQNVSAGYMKVLKSADSKYGSKIKQAVSKMATRKGLRPELLFLDLITDLR